jgi:hypothetical protein
MDRKKDDFMRIWNPFCKMWHVWVLALIWINDNSDRAIVAIMLRLHAHDEDTIRSAHWLSRSSTAPECQINNHKPKKIITGTFEQTGVREDGMATCVADGSETRLISIVLFHISVLGSWVHQWTTPAHQAWRSFYRVKAVNFCSIWTKIWFMEAARSITLRCILHRLVQFAWPSVGEWTSEQECNESQWQREWGKLTVYWSLLCRKS